MLFWGHFWSRSRKRGVHGHYFAYIFGTECVCENTERRGVWLTIYASGKGNSKCHELPFF